MKKKRILLCYLFHIFIKLLLNKYLIKISYYTRLNTFVLLHHFFIKLLLKKYLIKISQYTRFNTFVLLHLFLAKGKKKNKII